MSQQQKSNRFVGVVLETVGGPLLWGLIATLAYYVLLKEGFLSHRLLDRYTAGHPVEYVEVALFFVGLVAILRRGIRALTQSVMAGAIELQHRTTGTLRDRVAHVISQIESLPLRVQSSVLARRLSDAVMHIRRSDSTEQLEDELKYLSEMDADRSHEGYGLVRMIIWATPMLGFLGTVIGITLALGDLSPEALVNSPKEAMEGLLSGLSVAFDTTALALTLSIVLMFAQFMTQQLDTQLLSVVDRRATEELTPYFCRTGKTEDHQVATMQRMAQGVLESIESNSKRQADMWQNALEQSHQQWVHLIRDTGQTVENAVSGAVSGAVEQSLLTHTANLAKLEESATRAASQNWSEWQATATESLRQLHTQQAELSRHGEMLHRVLEATGDVINLEQALNQNLGALAGSKNFEDTVMSLSAAIQLLTSRLSKPVRRDAKVKLDSAGQERAA